MADYTFKKEISVYVVYGSLKYKLDISEITFNQSFREESYPVKTLHNQSSFEGSVINYANAANYQFTVPLIREPRNKVVFERLLDYATFDLYISTQQDDFKLEKCVLTNGTFAINKSRPLSLTVEGEASKLSIFTGTIPGTLQNTGVTTSTYNLAKIATLTLGGTDISSSVKTLTLELENDVSWNKYGTIQESLATTNASNSVYPSNFTIGTRVLGGTIDKYLEQGAPDTFTWGNNKALRLQVGEKVGNTVYGIDFNSSSCSFTNRIKPMRVFGEEYNWRMTQNPTALSSVLTYTTT